MYNLRYHIASLVGVFLALSIGLLLGTVVAERGTLDTQRDKLINGLEAEFAKLNDENASLSAENAARADFVADVVPALVAGKLAGKNVLVISSAGRTDGLAAVQAAVKAAGGLAVVVTIEKPGLGLTDAAVSSALGSLVASSPAGLEPSVVASLAAEWTSATPARPVTNALISAGALKAEGLSASVKADSVVVVAAVDGKPDTVALEVARAMAERGAITVGAQAVSADNGIAGAAFDTGLNAVDQMGRPEGMYALDLVLAGDATGYFGTGKGATAPYPKP